MSAVANVAINLDSRGVPAKLKQIADRGKEVDRSLNGAAAATTKAGREIKAAANGMQYFTDAATRGFDGLAKKVGKLTGALAGLDIARRFLSGFAQADKAAAAVRTLGVNSEQLQRQLLEVSNQTKGLASQTELLKASYDVASAGFNDAASAATILKAATLGAVGGLSDLNTVADATTSVLNAYGLKSDKAAKIVDGFIQTQNDGKIVVAQYAQQIGRVAPIAAAAGVGIEDLNAAISAVTATGVPVESTFAGLRQAIASVIKPTEEARKTSELLGLEFSSAAIKTKGFGGFLADVIEKTGGSEVALTKLFGSVEAVATILPLSNDGLEKFNTSLDNQKNSAGAAEEATEDLGGTVSAQVGSIINNIGNVARALDVVLGPAIKDITTQTNNLISAFSTAIQKFNDLITGRLDQASASFQFFNKVFAASESGLQDVKNAVDALNPSVAGSVQELDKMQGALNRARNAAQLVGPNAADGMQDLALQTQGAILALERLIAKRREALGQQGAEQTTPTGPDPLIAALQARINALLEQLNGGGDEAKRIQERISGLQQDVALNEKLRGIREKIAEADLAGNQALAVRLQGEERLLQLRDNYDRLKAKAGGAEREALDAKLQSEELLVQQDVSTQLNKLDSDKAKALEDQLRPLQEQRRLLEAQLNGRREEEELIIQIENATRGLGNAEAQRVSQLIRGNAELEKQSKQPNLIRDLRAQVKQLQDELDPVKLATETITNGAFAIGDAFSQAFTDVISGAKSTEEALADTFESIGKAFLGMAAEIIAKQLVMITLQTILKALGAISGGGAYGTGAEKPLTSDMDFSSAFSSGGFGIAPRANGGPVNANQPYIVGERGPELFMPSSSGMVLSNSATRDKLEQQDAVMSDNATRDKLEQQDAAMSSNEATRQQLIKQQNTMTTNRIREVERTSQAMLANPDPIDVRYESSVINNVEYVTAEQHQAGMAQAAQRGRALTLAALQNSVKTRRRVGL